MLIVRLSILSGKQLRLMYDGIQEKAPLPDIHNVKVILQNYDISEIVSIINQLKDGSLRINDITATITNNRRETLDTEIVKVDGAYAESGFPPFVLLCPNERGQSPVDVISRLGVKAEALGLRNLADLAGR